VNYCCNPQCFVCGGTVNPPHGLVYLLMLIIFFNYYAYNIQKNNSNNKLLMNIHKINFFLKKIVNRFLTFFTFFYLQSHAKFKHISLI
jgi:hypothetical protein